MSINNKLMSILLSIVLGGLTWLFLIFLNSISDIFPATQRIFVMLGGSWGGYIQFLCYVAFYFAILELNKKNGYIKEQYDGFDFNLLPKEDQLILTPEEVSEIKLNIIDMEKRGFSYLVNDFIKKSLHTVQKRSVHFRNASNPRCSDRKQQRRTGIQPEHGEVYDQCHHVTGFHRNSDRSNHRYRTVLSGQNR